MGLRGSVGAVPALALGFLVTGCGAPPLAVSDASGPRTVLQANDAQDGRLRWQIDLGPTDGATTPVLVGDTVIVAAPAGDATAYALDDGHVRWTMKDAPLPAAVAGDLAVFDLADRVEARRAASGDVAWVRQTSGNLIQALAGGPLALVVDAEPTTDKAMVTKPAVATKRPARNTTPPSSRVSLLDAASGRDAWAATLPGRVDLGSSAVSARHILATYAQDYSGRTTVDALRLSDGRSEWSYPASPVNSVSSAGDIPAVTIGLDRAKAAALDPKTGKRLWEVPEDDMIDPRLAPFLGLDGMTAFRRDPRTGKRLPGTVRAAYGIGAHGDLLVGADGRSLTALRGATEAWSADVARGADPVTYLDLDDHVVVSVTALGQKRNRG